MTRAEFDSKVQQRNQARDAFVSGLPSGYLFVLKGSTHSTFITDDTLLGPLVPGLQDNLASIDGKRAVTVTNAYVVAFFDKSLKGTDTPLLNGADSSYPEVTLRPPEHK